MPTPTTKPTILEAVALPNTKVALRVTPPESLTAIGGSITSYTVAVSDSDITPTVTTTTAATFSVVTQGATATHYLAPVASGLERAEVGSVTVVAVGPSGSTTASVAASVTMSPITSIPGTVRQGLCDILKAATLTVGSRTARVFVDNFGRPRSVRANRFDAGTFPVIEIGAGSYSSISTESTITDNRTIRVPVRIYDAATDYDAGADAVVAVAEQVVAEINAQSCLGLDWIGGIRNRAWSFSGGEVEASPNGDMVLCSMTFTLPVVAIYNEALT